MAHFKANSFLRSTLFLAASLGVWGCYSPERNANLECSTEGLCPGGMFCDIDNVCKSVAGEEDDSDARPSAVDAAPPVDAIPVDCTGDEDCADPPDLCHQAGTCNSDNICEFPRVECEPNETCAANECNPSTGACEQVAINEAAECQPTECGEYGSCVFGNNECAETGNQSRTCTDYICTGGACTASERSETQQCSRNTDGNNCSGGTTCGNYNACAFDNNNVCDEQGTQSRTCTDRKCEDGGCELSTRTESRNCSQDTDGDECGSTVCGNYGPCQFSSECDEQGTQSRTCTDRECGDGSCTNVQRTETRNCSRSTTGNVCGGGDSCGAYGSCRFSPINSCDEDGTQTRTCTERRCGSGSCQSTNSTESRNCSRDTDGDLCETEQCMLAPGEPGIARICCNNGNCIEPCGGDCINPI